MARACTNISNGRKIRLQIATITSRPTTAQKKKLLKKHAKKGCVSATELMEFESNYDDFEVTFNESI